MANVQVVRLLNNEEIIGDVSTIGETKQLFIKKPAVIQVMPDGSGQGGLGAYLPMAKDPKMDVKISDYAVIQVMPDGSGQGGLGAYLPMAKDPKMDVKISDYAVITVYPPNDEVLNVYNKSFGNGIITSPGLIT